LSLKLTKDVLRQPQKNTHLQKKYINPSKISPNSTIQDFHPKSTKFNAQYLTPAEIQNQQRGMHPRPNTNRYTLEKITLTQPPRNLQKKNFAKIYKNKKIGYVNDVYTRSNGERKRDI